jgi:hypothetical protein
MPKLGGPTLKDIYGIDKPWKISKPMRDFKKSGYELGELGRGFLDYEYPEDLYEQQTNVIGQAGAAAQTRANRALSQRQAAQTGGRLGSISRGFSDIGGQVATGQQMALANLAKEKMNIETRMKLAGLQAYIQKHGIDANVMMALKQLQAQENAALYGGIGEFLGGAIQLLPFVL